MASSEQLTRQRSQREVENLMGQFNELDSEGHGVLGLAELGKFISVVFKLDAPDEDIKMMLGELPLETSNHVNRSEFPLFVSKCKTYVRFRLATEGGGGGGGEGSSSAHTSRPARQRPKRHSTMRPGHKGGGGGKKQQKSRLAPKTRPEEEEEAKGKKEKSPSPTSTPTEKTPSPPNSPPPPAVSPVTVVSVAEAPADEVEKTTAAVEAAAEADAKKSAAAAAAGSSVAATDAPSPPSSPPPSPPKESPPSPPSPAPPAANPKEGEVAPLTSSPPLPEVPQQEGDESSEEESDKDEEDADVPPPSTTPPQPPAQEPRPKQHPPPRESSGGFVAPPPELPAPPVPPLPIPGSSSSPAVSSPLAQTSFTLGKGEHKDHETRHRSRSDSSKRKSRKGKALVWDSSMGEEDVQQQQKHHHQQQQQSHQSSGSSHSSKHSSSRHSKHSSSSGGTTAKGDAVDIPPPSTPPPPPPPSTGAEGLDFFLQLSSMLASPKQDAELSASEADYYEARFQSEEMLQDPLCKIPKDDVEVARFHRPLALTRGPRPTVEVPPDPYVALIFDTLFSDFPVYRRNYLNRSYKFPAEGIPADAHQDEYEEHKHSSHKLVQLFSPAEGSSQGSDPLHPEWIKPQTADADTANAKARSVGRESLFAHYRFDQRAVPAEVEMVNRSLPDAPSAAPLGNRVLLSVDYMYFALGDFEPFFGSIALYDATTRTKLSETFYFDTNTTPMKQLLGADPAPSPTRALFTLPHERALQGMNIWVVLVVEKVLSGDLESARDPYLRAEATATGEPTKDCVKAQKVVQERIGEVCRRHGTHRQFFCCSAFELVQEDGTMNLDNPKLEFEATKSGRGGPFLRARIEDTNDVFAMIAELKEALRKGKRIDTKKTIPGQWRAHVYSASARPLDGVIVDSMRRPVSCAPQAMPFDKIWDRSAAEQPMPEIPTGAKAREIIGEMVTFSPTPEPVVCRAFFNNMFIYPETLNLSREKKKMNLCVTVYLRDDDTPLSEAKEHCLQCFVGRTGLAQSQTSAVIFHTKSATFIDEMKVNLPFPLTPAHHLLFIFRNVHVDTEDDASGQQQQQQQHEQVWHATMPLVTAMGNCIESMPYSLMVAPGMPVNRYRSVHDTSGTESQRLQMFRVRVFISSTVYPQDKAVVSFLQTALNSKLPAMAVLDSLKTITAIKREVGVQFFIPLMRSLCICACSETSTEVSMLSIKAIFAFLSNISQVLPGQGPRYPLLQEYVTYDHDNLKSVASAQTSKDVFEGLASAFANFLGMLSKTADDDSGSFSYEPIFGFAWFVLDMISKSLTLAVADAGHLGDPRRHTWLSKEERWEEFARNLKKIATNLGKHIATSVRRADCKMSPDANTSFALFLRDLLAVFHRGRVMEAAKIYLDQLHAGIRSAGDGGSDEHSKESSTISLMITDFLLILADYEHFVPLSMPTVDRVTSLDGLCDKLLKRHMLSGFIVREVFRLLGSKSQDMRLSALQLLIDLLGRLEFDERYQAPASKARIAGMFFPLVLLMIDDWRHTKEWQERADVFEEQALYLIFTHILKNIDRDFLTQWWSVEVLSRLTIFLTYIGNSVRAFKWKPGSASEAPAKSFAEARRRLVRDFLAFCNLSADMPLLPTDSPSPSLPSAGTGTLRGRSALKEAAAAATGAQARHLGTGSVRMVRMLNSRTVSMMAFVNPNVMQQESASGGRPSALQAPSPTLPQSQQQQQQPQQAAMPSVAMSLRPRSTSLAGPPSLSVIEFHGRALCTETSLVHLDIMELLTATFHSELLNKENILISKVFSVMILFLQTSQSARFYGHYFASQRSFITKYRSLLFTTDNPFIGDLCDELVRMCNFSNDTIRSFATAALYIVAKSNYKEMMNIDRTKIHVTTALAKLSLQNTRMFERSLATMALYAAHDFEHSLSGSPSSSSSRGHHSASTSASSSRLRKVALATAAMSTMVEEAESKRRQATSEKLIQEVEQANVMQVVEFRAQVLEDWCSSKLLLLDAIKAETESFPARLEVIVDLDASISAYEQELDSIVSKLAEAESPPKSAVAKVTRLQQKWAALKKSSSPLVVALQEEKPRREEAAVAAESYAAQVSEMFAWFVTTAQSLMCTERCISSSSQADQLSALTAAAAQIEEAFAAKLGELKKAEAAMQEVERLAPELTATTSKDIEAAFAAVTKLIDTHRSEVAKDVDAHEQKKALFTKYRAAKDKLGAMLKGQLGTALADGTQSLETFTAEANRAAEEAIMLHKAYERASASIEKRWQHVRAVLECASELTARVSELSGRDAAKRKAAAEHAGAEQQEAVFAREFGEVCKWITQIIQHCTAPLLVTTEEAATALLDENLRMQEDVKAKQGQKERLEGASAEIAKMLKRKPFAASTTRELQDMWQRATELLHDRRLSIQAEISKQRLHEDMRREFADKIAGLDRWIEELLKDTPENALKADPDLTADMQQIRDQRASLAEAKVADILRFSKISVEQVEEKFRNIKAIIQRKQQEIEAAAPSPAPGEGTPPGSPTAARRGGSTSGQTAASIAAAAAAAFGAPPPAAPPGSSSPGLLQVPTGRPGGAMTDKDRQRMFMRMRPSMKDSFMVFDTTRRSKFAQSIQDLSAHLTKIIHDSQKLNRLKMEELDSELLRELQYEISLGYTDTPDLHITWLLQLASAHLVEKNLVEAAQCKLRVAKIIFDNIRDKLPVQVPIEELQAVYPSLLSRPDEPRSETRILSPVFSERGFIDMLRSSITLFEGSEHFEFCVAIYNLIAPLLLVHHSNVELSGHYKAVSKLFQDIASKDSARMLANYYRVGFYGASFDELNGVEFIYRMGAEVHLFELAQTLKTKYSKKAEVEILDSTRGTSELDPSKRYVQVTAVKPYLTAEEAAARTTFFEKHTLVQRFYLETPFTKNASKAHAMEAKDQWKRRVILTAADTFPSILKRLRVMARETVELTPIQNAIESVCRRTADMRAEISNVTDKGAVNLAALQLILQGSVLLQVNSGVLEFCQGFLSPEGRREWPEQVPVLCDVLNEFVGVCRRALDVNKELVKPDQVAFHEQLEQGYIDLEKKVSAYIAGASAPLPPPPPVDLLQSPSASSSSSSSQQV